MIQECLVTFDFGGSTISTSLVEKLRRCERACSDSGHHAQSVCSLQITFDASLLEALTAAIGDVKVTIDVDGARYFTGAVPPTWKARDRGEAIGGGADTDPIALEVVDSSNDLGYEITDEDLICWQNCKVCDPADESHSLVHKLIGVVNYPNVAITDTISTVIPAFNAESGTIGDLIDELLYDYGLTWKMDLYDRVVLQRWSYEDPAAVASPDETTLIADFAAEKFAREGEGVQLTWWPQKTKNKALVFMADLPFGDDNLRSGYPVQPGFMWPDEANVVDSECWFDYQDRSLANMISGSRIVKNKDFTQLILTKNHSLDVHYDTGLVEAFAPVFQNKRARIAYDNPTDDPVNIFYCDIYADVVYRAAANKVSSLLVSGTKKIIKVEAPYIVDQLSADRAASMRAGLLLNPFRITCSSETAYGIGTVASVSDPYLGIADAICLIVERVHDADSDLYVHKCNTLAPLNVSAVLRASRVLPDAPKTKEEDPRQQAGSLRSAILGRLSNTSHVIPTDPEGNNGDFTGCASTLTIYNGFDDDSANWSFSATPGAGVTGSLVDRTYTVTGLTADTSYVDLTATRENYPTVTCRFNLAKARAGVEGDPGDPGEQGATVTIIAPSTSFRGMPGMGYSPSAIILSLQCVGITPANYQWQVFSSGAWTNDSTEATRSISPSEIESAKTFRCVVNGTLVSNSATISKIVVERPNIMDLSGWTPGASMPPAGYTLNGLAEENVLETILDTYGVSEVAWKCGSDVGSDDDGGFTYSFPCDPLKTYRLIASVRKNAAGGYSRFGCLAESTENLDGSPVTDPLFVDANLPAGDYIVVGIIHPAAYSGGSTAMAGVYDARTFEQVAAGTEYRMAAGAVSQAMRNYLYGSTDLSTYQWIWRPIIQEIQAKENSKENLMYSCQMELKAHSAYVSALVANDAFIDALAARIVQFKESVGSVSAATPAAGDLLCYMGKDPRRPEDTTRLFELALKEYVGDNGGSGYTEEWMSHFLTKKSGNTIGLVLAGVLSACSGVKSTPGMVWTSRVHPFGTAYASCVGNGNGVSIAAGEEGEIARSTDGGLTWGSLIANPFGTSFISALAFGNGVWVAAGAGGKIARSTDGGLTWGTLVANPFGTSAIYGIEYGNGVWVAAGFNGQIARSTDGGLTWGSLVANPFGISGIYEIGYGNGLWIAVGEDGQIARSTDGGLTWGSLVANPFGTSAIYKIRYGNGLWIAAGSGGKIARSIDGGLTWGSLVANPFGTYFVGALAFGNGVWIAAGSGGKIARSTDGGLTWAEPNQSATYQPFGPTAFWGGIVFADDSRFILVGDNGLNSCYIVTSDWLEAGSGVVEAGSTDDGNFITLSTGLTFQWGTRVVAANEISLALNNNGVYPTYRGAPANGSLPVPFRNVAWHFVGKPNTHTSSGSGSFAGNCAMNPVNGSTYWIREEWPSNYENITRYFDWMAIGFRNIDAA